MGDPEWDRLWLCMSKPSLGGWSRVQEPEGGGFEQVLHLKSAAVVTYLPSWPLDMTASCLPSTLTTVSTFSLKKKNRGVETEQQRGCARDQLMTVTAQRKELLQHHKDNKGPGCLIVALDTWLSPLPSRTWASSWQVCRDCAWTSSAGTASARLAVSKTHLSIWGIVFSL